MKQLFYLAFAAISVISCNGAGETVDANATASEDSLDKAGQTPTVTTQPPKDGEIARVDSANITSIEWIDGQERTFASIKEGENLDVSFRFKNTGTRPLVIARVWAQCGCTIPETPQKPYAPGETGVIRASFNSTGKPGTNIKEVYLSANSNPQTTVLKFQVDVKPKADKK